MQIKILWEGTFLFTRSAIRGRKKNHVLVAIVVMDVVFSNLGQSLGLIRSPLVIIIVIKVIVITNRSFGEQEEIGLHHVNDPGEQRVAENRRGWVGFLLLLLRVSSIFMSLKVIREDYKGSGICGCLSMEWQ